MGRDEAMEALLGEARRKRVYIHLGIGVASMAVAVPLGLALALGIGVGRWIWISVVAFLVGLGLSSDYRLATSHLSGDAMKVADFVERLSPSARVARVLCSFKGYSVEIETGNSLIGRLSFRYHPPTRDVPPRYVIAVPVGLPFSLDFARGKFWTESAVLAGRRDDLTIPRAVVDMHTFLTGCGEELRSTISPQSTSSSEDFYGVVKVMSEIIFFMGEDSKFTPQRLISPVDKKRGVVVCPHCERVRRVMRVHSTHAAPPPCRRCGRGMASLVSYGNRWTASRYALEKMRRLKEMRAL
ncbi:MAG: hypothetical protein ACUVXI_02615 [bacterium]